MKKFLVLGLVVFAALFLAVSCGDGDEDDCSKVCKDWKEMGWESKADCTIECTRYKNGGDYDYSSLNEYMLECTNAGHSEADCETWYYED